MSEMLKNAKNKVVGLKQLLRELEAKTVLSVYIASDAEAELKSKIHVAIGDQDINIVEVDSMRELGDVCNIDVSAACAAILKNNSLQGC